MAQSRKPDERADIHLVYSEKLGTAKKVELALQKLGYKVAGGSSTSSTNSRYKIFLYDKHFKSNEDCNELLYFKTNSSTANFAIVHTSYTTEIPDDFPTGLIPVHIVHTINSTEIVKKILELLFSSKSDELQKDYALELNRLLDAVRHFNEEMAFILAVNINILATPFAETLSRIPWVKVFDFSDGSEKTSGLPLVATRQITPGKFAISTVDEDADTLTNSLTSWTICSDDAEMGAFEDHTRKIWDHCAGRRVPVFVTLWYPKNSDRDLDILEAVSQLRDHRMKYVFIGPSVLSKKSALGRIASIEGEKLEFVFPLPLILQWLPRATRGGSEGELQHTLPAAAAGDKQTRTVTLDERTYNSISDESRLQLITIERGSCERDDKYAKKSGLDFLRGGPITWNAIATEEYDASRDIAKKIKIFIRKKHLTEGKGGIITIYHHPGSGGTTLGRRILWDMRKEVVCIAVLESLENTLADFGRKIADLRDKTHLPVLLLIDGYQRSDVEHILDSMPHLRIIVLHVQRYYNDTDTGRRHGGRNLNGSHYYLKNATTVEDSKRMYKIYSKFAKNRITALEKERPQIYEFGLMGFDDEFKRVREYIEGQLENQDNPKYFKTMKVVKCLALVKYYTGQLQSVPREMFGEVLKDRVFDLVTLELLSVVPGKLIHESKISGEVGWFIGYYAVAREILRQVLHVPLPPEPSNVTSPIKLQLSGEARRSLKELAVEFLDVLKSNSCARLDNEDSAASIAKSIFIDRESDSSASENISQSEFSFLITDVFDAEHQQELFEKLVAVFPNNADFHAHRGRFYGTQKRFAEARRSFEEAISVRELQRVSKRQRDQPMSRYYHMYGKSESEAMRQKAADAKSDFKEVLNSAESAIDKFRKCQQQFIGNPTYGIMGEVRLRLFIVKEKIKKDARKDEDCEVSDDIRENLERFTFQSYCEIDRLLARCWEIASREDLKKANFLEVLKDYISIFENMSPGLEQSSRHLVDREMADACRLAKLMRKHFSDNYELKTGINANGDLEEMVGLLENIIYGSRRDDISTEVLQWLRLKRFSKKSVAVDKTLLLEALEKIEMWIKKEASKRAGLSNFYCYVINLVLVMNLKKSDLRNTYSKNAEYHFSKLMNGKQPEEMTAVYSRRFGRKPREFLAKHGPLGIIEGQLITSSGYETDFDQNKERFRRCRGRLSGKNRIISTEDVFPRITFYVSHWFYHFTEQHAKESVLVSFYVRFSPYHGAEAFDVAEIKECRSCRGEVEFRHSISAEDDQKNRCPYCGK